MQIKGEAVRDLLSPIAEGADHLFEPFDPWSLHQFIEFIKTGFNGWQIRILNHFCFVKPVTENLFQLINFAANPTSSDNVRDTSAACRSVSHCACKTHFSCVCTSLIAIELLLHMHLTRPSASRSNERGGTSWPPEWDVPTLVQPQP